ncbi:MAG: hypothetical protein HYR72_06695 [Deltaproteobacteria bacterium]|nr:hypothetical protein [Deltaproteobacteria bacterium]MBI3387134.1 hypothetical protein [Deltaproteobacteria bacterium]
MTNATITLLTEDTDVALAAQVSGDDLWLAGPELMRATGWTLTRDGFCRGSLCVPIPPGREAEFARSDGSVNLAALARHMGQVLVHDDSATVWVLDASTAARSAARTSLEAPDFTLPDLGGRMHSLHEHRGKKVLLASWASW